MSGPQQMWLFNDGLAVGGALVCTIPGIQNKYLVPLGSRWLWIQLFKNEDLYVFCKRVMYMCRAVQLNENNHLLKPNEVKLYTPLFYS